MNYYNTLCVFWQIFSDTRLGSFLRVGISFSLSTINEGIVIFVYVLALTVCSSCFVVFGSSAQAPKVVISTELKSMEESTEAGKRLANTELSFTRFFQTGRLRPIHLESIASYLLVKAIITIQPIQKQHLQGQSGFLTVDRLDISISMNFQLFSGQSTTTKNASLFGRIRGNTIMMSSTEPEIISLLDFIRSKNDNTLT